MGCKACHAQNAIPLCSHWGYTCSCCCCGAGKYEANQQLILGRYVVTPSQRTLLTLHAHLTSSRSAPPLPCLHPATLTGLPAIAHLFFCHVMMQLVGLPVTAQKILAIS